MPIGLSVGPGEEPGEVRRIVGQLEDLAGHPVGLDQSCVVEKRSDAVEMGSGIPIDHLWLDTFELTQRIPAAVLECSQPSPDLWIVGDWLECQTLLHRA